MNLKEPLDYNEDNEAFDYKFRRLQEDRSDFSTKCNIIPYQTNGDNEITQTNFSNQMLKSYICSDKLSKHYFSKCNLDHVQQLLILNVSNISNNQYKIGRQSDRELLLVMRHIYLNDATNKNNNIIFEVNRLNNIVINKIMPKLISNIEQHANYIHDINSPIRLMEPPVNVNSSNSRGTLVGDGNRFL